MISPVPSARRDNLLWVMAATLVLTGLCLSLMVIQTKHFGRVRAVVYRLAVSVGDVVVALGRMVPPR
jgi:hypothetical protein